MREKGKDGDTQKTLLLATRNAGKTRELGELLAASGILVVNLEHFPNAGEVEETGDTFEANAVLKATAGATETGMATLADDSGLVVDCLDGQPGVRSARFAGPKATDAENNRLLLERMQGIAEGDRTARFVSVVALALPNGTIHTFKGETHGRILTAPRGNGGFGYDPLFLSDELGVTFAEADLAAKNRISHRGRAIAMFLAVAPTLL